MYDMYQHEAVVSWYVPTRDSSQLICIYEEVHETVVNWYVPTRGSSQLICTLHEAVVNWYVRYTRQ